MHSACALLFFFVVVAAARGALLWNEVMGLVEMRPVCVTKETSIIKLMWCSAGGSYCIC